MTKDQEFSPTPAMKLYAYQRAKNGKKAKDSKLSRLVGVTPETVCRWKKINGFMEWLDHEIAYYSAPIMAVLEQKALEKIKEGDFRYWSEMFKMYSRAENMGTGFEFSTQDV
jgi:DNA-binding SARP family transcriptional activator